MIDDIKQEVAGLHAELVRYGLVVWTAGNVSARVPGQDLLVIKPSGVSYDELTPENKDATGKAATKFREPSWEELRGLSADERRAILEYFKRINAANPP